MTDDQTVYRALLEPLDAPSDGLTLIGYCAVFNRAAEIVDHLGEYDEIIRPGAFKRSINSGRTPHMLFQHGRHPVWGQYPLGSIETLRRIRRACTSPPAWSTHRFLNRSEQRFATERSLACP